MISDHFIYPLNNGTIHSVLVKDYPPLYLVFGLNYLNLKVLLLFFVSIFWAPEKVGGGGFKPPTSWAVSQCTDHYAMPLPTCCVDWNQTFDALGWNSTFPARCLNLNGNDTWWKLNENIYSLWYPELVPQITGGRAPETPVIENVSVRQFVAWLNAFPARYTALPPDSQPLEVNTVVGPVMTKVLRSKRSWNLIFRC